MTNSTAPIRELLADHQAPCVSIYMPFARTKPLSEQNRICFKSLMDRADSAMRGHFGSEAARRVIEKLRAIADDEILRAASHSGLAVFASPDYLRIIRVDQSLGTSLEIGDFFHIKPLVRSMQLELRFAVLCLSPNNVRLLEGDQHALTELKLEQIPRNIGQTFIGLGREVPAEADRLRWMRPHQPPTDPENLGMAAFIRAVDRAVWEHYSRRTRLPLIVCADPKLLAQFFAMTNNPDVLEAGIPHNPDHLSTDRICQKAVKLLEPRHRQEIHRLIDRFCAAKAHERGSDELAPVAEAAANGRIDTLLIDERARIPGVLHRASGMIEGPRITSDAQPADVLDDLAELVLQKDGEVFVLPHEQMPTDAGLAAVFRY